MWVLMNTHQMIQMLCWGKYPFKSVGGAKIYQLRFWMNFWSNYAFFCVCIHEIWDNPVLWRACHFLQSHSMHITRFCLNPRTNTLVMVENDEGELGSLSKFWCQLTVMFPFFCIFHSSFWWSQTLGKAAAKGTILKIVDFFLNFQDSSNSVSGSFTAQVKPT